ALLVPAVQKVRDAAQRMQCGNNLRQLGIALHNYQSTYDTLPPGARTTPTLHGWTQFILPFIEQGTLAQQYNWNLNWNNTNAPQQAVVNTPLKMLQCPAATNPRTDTSGGWQASAGDYAPLNGVSANLVSGNFIPATADLTGVLRVDIATPMGQITDGTSST